MENKLKDLKIKELAALYRDAVNKSDDMAMKAAEAAMTAHATARMSDLKASMAAAFAAEALK